MDQFDPKSVAGFRISLSEEHEGNVLFTVGLVVPNVDGYELFLVRVEVEGVQIEKIGESDQRRMTPEAPDAT